MIELDANACQSFDDDGFVIVEQLIDNNHIGNLHRAFSDLFNGKFETGVRPDEVNWQQADGDPSLTRQICNGWRANQLDKNYFPILWREDGYRTPQIATYLRQVQQ